VLVTATGGRGEAPLRRRDRGGPPRPRWQTSRSATTTGGNGSRGALVATCSGPFSPMPPTSTLPPPERTRHHAYR
jgi:hypothetical protein